ncbi:MAG: hypothetical protein ACI9LO_000794 [Planctomycetota bacterium]|jgi:hypothetical protein
MLVGLFSFSVVAQGTIDQDKDRLYITDELRLSLYEKPNSQSNVVKLLSSGDLLQIEELSGPYARVIAPGGAEGWVKKGFLTASPTSNILLEQEIETNSRLTAELEKLGNSKVLIDQYEKDIDLIVEKLEQVEDQKKLADRSNIDLQQKLQQRLAAQQLSESSAVNQIETVSMAKDQPPLSVLWETAFLYWDIVALMVGAIILFSFLLGKMIIESRIKSKFHGIKIW